MVHAESMLTRRAMYNTGSHRQGSGVFGVLGETIVTKQEVKPALILGLQALSSYTCHARAWLHVCYTCHRAGTTTCMPCYAFGYLCAYCLVISADGLLRCELC